MTLHERFRKYMETMVNMLTVNGNQYKLFGFCVETYLFRQMDNRGMVVAQQNRKKLLS